VLGARLWLDWQITAFSRSLWPKKDFECNYRSKEIGFRAARLHENEANSIDYEIESGRNSGQCAVFECIKTGGFGFPVGKMKDPN